MNNKILLVLFLVYAAPLVFAAENETLSEAGQAPLEIIRLEAVIPEEVMLGLVYTSLFKLTNLNHSRGVESFVNATVFYNISRDGGLVLESSFSKLVNAYTSSSTGYFFVSELGEYTLCGHSPVSNAVCKDFHVINPLEIPCEASLGLSLNKRVFGNNERVEIRNSLAVGSAGSAGSGVNDYPYIIEYWIEDLFGNIVKPRINTSNENEKSFTPQVREADAVFVVRNRLLFIGCNNTNTHTQNEDLFVVRNQDFKEPGEQSPGTIAAAKEEQGKDYYIASFYTRTKKYHPEINIYANVKAAGHATLFLKGEESSEWRSIELSEKLSFSAKARPGRNFYELKLYKDDEEVDSKSLIVELEGDSSTEAAKLNASKTNSSKALNSTIAALAKASQKQAKPALKGAEGNVSKEIGVAEKKPLEASAPKPGTPSGGVVYESPSAKAGSYAPYLVIFTLLLVITAAFLLKHK